MGGADIRVPDGLNVEVSDFALMGGNGVDIGDSRPDPGGPTLHLRLISIMGGTDVKRGRRKTRASAAPSGSSTGRTDSVLPRRASGGTATRPVYRGARAAAPANVNCGIEGGGFVWCRSTSHRRGFSGAMER